MRKIVSHSSLSAFSHCDYILNYSIQGIHFFTKLTEYFENRAITDTHTLVTRPNCEIKVRSVMANVQDKASYRYSLFLFWVTVIYF